MTSSNHLQAHQLGRDLGHPLGPVVGEPPLHDDVLPIDIPVLSHALREGGGKMRSSNRSARNENADFGDLFAGCAFAVNAFASRAPATVLTNVRRSIIDLVNRQM